MSRKRYDSDLSDEQWAILAPLLPPAKPGGRPRSINLREIVNAMLYLLRTGCPWRHIPHDLPRWGTVWQYFRCWRDEGVLEQVHEVVRDQVRRAAGKDPNPSAGSVDSQSVATTEKGGVRGYDAGKKVKGRKRHLVVDTLGLIHGLKVHPASIQDRDGAKLVLEPLLKRLPRLEVIWADGGYAGQLVAWVDQHADWRLEIIKRPDGAQGFVLLPKRWVIERTFAWLGKCRRLSKDYEQLIKSSEAMIRLAMLGLMVRRLAPT